MPRAKAAWNFKTIMPTQRRSQTRSSPDGFDKSEPKETTEKVVFINRCAKVVKGGRRFSFSALIVSGNHNGRVGIGFGKANEVSEAIRKATESAKKRMVDVAIHENTIPHEVLGRIRRRSCPSQTSFARNWASSQAAVCARSSRRPGFATCWQSRSGRAIQPMW